MESWIELPPTPHPTPLHWSELREAPYFDDSMGADASLRFDPWLLHSKGSRVGGGDVTVIT